MKVVIYTTQDCKFSQQEKEYLNSLNISFEEKNLETNKDFLTEMLSISNNFAGTPVTEITKDDGEKVVLKGFTKEDFDVILNPNTTQELGQTVANTDNVLINEPSVAQEAPQVAMDLPADTATNQSDAAATIPQDTSAPTVSEPMTNQPLTVEPSFPVTPSEQAPSPLQENIAVNTAIPPQSQATVNDIGVVDLSQTVTQAVEQPVAPVEVVGADIAASAQTSEASTQQISSTSQLANPAEPVVDNQLNSVLQNLQNQANSNS